MSILIFVSYSHVDSEVCRRITQILKQQPGFDVWYDRGLVPGEVYRRTIVNQIKQADYFIVLISRSAVQSEWVLDEVEYAKKVHKRIIPIWVEDAELPDDLDMILQRYHSLFYHLRSSDEQFTRTLCAIFTNREQQEEAESRQKPLVGFGNEFSEAANLRMKDLLEGERAGKYAQCYEPENARVLGTAYLFGGPCQRNRERARHYFRTAAHFGNRDAACYLLQMELEKREDETWDEPDPDFYEPIMRQISTLASEGCIPAKLFLGNCYWYGKYGCPVDVDTSASFYGYCAKLGNARSQYIMSSNFYYGDGVPKDYDLAIMYANLAVEQKYLKAWRRWGKFYRDGLAVPQDYNKARECYERGAAMGDFNCYNKVGDMLYFGWGFPVDYDAAFQYYSRGEQSPEHGQKYGLMKAEEALGRCFELGHGTAQNLKIAEDKYLEGYRLGSLECRDAYLRLKEGKA